MQRNAHFGRVRRCAYILTCAHVQCIVYVRSVQFLRDLKYSRLRYLISAGSTENVRFNPESDIDVLLDLRLQTMTCERTAVNE